MQAWINTGVNVLKSASQEVRQWVQFSNSSEGKAASNLIMSVSASDLSAAISNAKLTELIFAMQKKMYICAMEDNVWLLGLLSFVLMALLIGVPVALYARRTRDERHAAERRRIEQQEALTALLRAKARSLERLQGVELNQKKTMKEFKEVVPTEDSPKNLAGVLRLLD